MKKRSREVGGDGFGCRFYGGPPPVAGDGYYVGFGSLYQGDHLGVEFALASHDRLLSSKALLVPERRIQAMPFSPSPWTMKGSS